MGGGQEGAAVGFNWREYRPSRAVWLWSCVGCLVTGLLVGGWMIGKGADQMAATARQNGRADLAASICVQRFLDAPDVAARLAELKDGTSWERDKDLQTGGWTTIAGLEPIEGAASLCADELAAMELPLSAAVAAEGSNSRKRTTE